MSQNPWKKQAEGNKPPGGSPNVPPWMKNKTQQPQQPQQPQTIPQPTTNPGVPVTQPPPPINKPPGPQTNPPAGGAQTGNVPPWMKNKQSNNVPPPIKPPGNVPTPATTNVPATSGNVPPWMKNKQATSPISTERNAQKQKEQQEARIQKLKQEQEKKKREEELIRQQKQRKRMAIQQQHSKLRQQSDKLNESKKKTNKNVKKNSPKKQENKSQSRSLKKLNQNLTLFHKFLLRLNFSCSKDEQYHQKIETQKQLIDILAKFCNQSQQGIIKYMQQRKIANRKKNIINLQNVVIQYGLVQGISGQSGNLYFKTRNIQLLQQKFSCYQVMFNLILKLIKKMNIFRLRTPLMCRVSYKGIQFLCQGICDDILQSVPAPAQNFVQIHGELTQLQKQLKQSGYEYLNRRLFSIKKVCVDGSQFYILYLNQNLNTVSNNQNIQSNRLSFFPNTSPLLFQNLIDLSLISSHQLGITYSNMRSFPEVKRNTTQAFKQAYLNLFQIAHSTRIVHASCQGQIDQSSFWNLFFQHNAEIWDMVRKAHQSLYGQLKSGQQLKLKNKHILAKLLQLIIPISFGIGKQKIVDKLNQTVSYKRVPVFLQHRPVTYTYPLDTLQYYEITQLFQKNIQNSFKLKTAQQSCLIQQQIVDKSGQLFLRRINVFVNKVKVLFRKGIANRNLNMVIQAIKLAEDYQFKKGKQIQKLIIYPLLMTFYMTVGQSQLQATEIENRQKSQANDKQKQSQIKDTKQKAQSQVQQFKHEEDKGIQKSQQINEPKLQVKMQFETKMLKIFNSILVTISQLFQDQSQIWYNANLYTILSSYYSRIKLDKDQQNKQGNKQEITKQQSSIPTRQQIKNQSKGRMFSNSHAFDNNLQRSYQKQKEQSNLKSSKAVSQPLNLQYNNTISNPHPYYKQCMKFLQISHNISLRFYGAYSPLMAQFLLHQAQIFYNVKQNARAQNSIHEALKIYKTSSKHNRSVLNCSLTLGKLLIEKGKTQKNHQSFDNGIEMLERGAQQLFIVNKDLQAVQIYNYLYNNLRSFSKDPFTKGSQKKTQIQFIQEGTKIIKMDNYLQKITQISLNSRNVQSLKQIIKRCIKSQLNFYSKDRAVALKDLYDDYIKEAPQEKDENDRIYQVQENIKDLEKQQQNFGGFIDMIKWSLGILRAKAENLQWERASEIMKKTLGLYNQKQIVRLLIL